MRKLRSLMDHDIDRKQSFYHPQRSCDKVMFLHLSVILSTGRRACAPRTLPAMQTSPPATHAPPVMHAPCHTCPLSHLPPATHLPPPHTPPCHAGPWHACPMPCTPPAMQAPCHACPLPRTPPTTRVPSRILQDAVNEWVLSILLEILI